MRGIVNASLQYRFLVIVLAIVLLVTGFGQLRAMPVDVLPEFTPPYVEIQTEAPGLSAKEVEGIVTVSLEQSMLAGVPWLESIRSKSMPGLSTIYLYFEPGTDLNRARQLVGERIALSAALLPAVSKKPVMIQPLSSSSRFMIVGLSASDMSLVELSVLARWTIAPRLMPSSSRSNVSESSRATTVRGTAIATRFSLTAKTLARSVSETWPRSATIVKGPLAPAPYSATTRS